MFSLLGQAKRVIQVEAIATDNIVFRLHYKLTCPLLMVATLLLGARQYFGDAIACYVHGIPDRIIDAFCWVEGTYTIEELVHEDNVAFQGVGPYNDRMHHKVYHGFYQWVPLAMAASAICFYLPRFLWKGLENKRISAILADNKLALVEPRPKEKKLSKVKAEEKEKNGDKDKKEEVKEDLAAMDVLDLYDNKAWVEQRHAMARIVELFRCLYKNDSIRPHRNYLLKFVFCEFLNLLNVLMQLMATNFLLNGSFFSYGLQHLGYIANWIDEQNSFHPGQKVFPRMAQCTFSKHGPSGNVQELQALCILPHNILIEKIYLVLWIWYIILAFISAIAFVIRMASLCYGPAARWLVCLKSWMRGYDTRCAVLISEHDLGDWFVLEQIGKNVDPVLFADILRNVANVYVEDGHNHFNFDQDTLDVKFSNTYI